MKKQKGVKVILESGFIGYVLSTEFFLIGSEVKCFDRIPLNCKDWANLVSETGIVKELK